jgi:hypothetical protein
MHVLDYHPKEHLKMKLNTSLLIGGLAVFLTTTTAWAGKDLSEAEVPQAVLTAFKTAYPNATQTEYEEDHDNGVVLYEIEFRHDGKKMEVKYSADGQVVKTEQDD